MDKIPKKVEEYRPDERVTYKLKNQYCPSTHEKVEAMKDALKYCEVI